MWLVIADIDYFTDIWYSIFVQLFFSGTDIHRYKYKIQYIKVQ